ncbi:hypothetical protein R1sor_005277 [Riccia sorocarpa]|uniref:Phosphatidylserine decarboxylase proenzyme 1, mitochondrial n=1 Tax=Riccia sorocarpa TaxID=122646 RepID=A0ABD3HLC4_9MARC
MALVGVKRWSSSERSFWSCQNVRNLNVAVGNASRAAHPRHHPQQQPVDVSGRRRQNEGTNLFLPGATIATLFMLGALHVRRMYDEKQLEEARRQGIEPSFGSDWKASFLQVLPLRLISRTWGTLTSIELPLWLRPHVYNSWARAFKANLDEASRPIEEYVSLRDFFTRSLKDGVRPLDSSTSCLLSPTDGIVLQCGQVEGTGTMIEQVKGFSYSVSALLGSNPRVSPASVLEDGKTSEKVNLLQTVAKSPEDSASQLSVPRATKGLFYCVLYLGPGDYHRIHSPTDWDILYRRHFYGRLFPVNERSVKTVRNLYVVNERVVLEGSWSQGFMAMAAVGATNVGSIELKFEPELKTNLPKVGLSLATVNSRTYEGNGLTVKAGEEVALFNLGSTVVLVFEAPSADREGEPVHEISKSSAGTFRFNVQNGQRIKMGQALGNW